MGWFNYYGLAIMAIIMIPNIVYAVKNKTAAAAYHNKIAEIFEQIGRYGCFVLMIFNIPYAYFDFWFDRALSLYLCVNGGLCLAYLVFWAVCGKSRGMLKALSLSIIPAAVFLFSGVMLAYIPLIVFAAIFGAAHITISYKSVDKRI